MRDIMTVLGVVAVIVILVMLMGCPDAKENLRKEHRKSLILIFVPMIVLVALVIFVMSHVGL